MCPPRADTRVGPYVLFVILLVVTAAFAQQPGERARTEALARRATERLQTLQRESDRLASQESVARVENFFDRFVQTLVDADARSRLRNVRHRGLRRECGGKR